MRRLGFPQLTSLIAVIAASCAWALLFCGSAAADGGCDLVAATNGNDSNPGTASAPFGTAQQLADSLSPNQTGCLRAGTYPGGLRVDTPNVSVTSFPGERATISGKTYLTKNADRVQITDLNLVSGVGTGQFVNGTGDVFDNVDVTSNNTENCFIVGSDDPTYGRAEGLVIQNSRIHNCGQLNPDTNQDHGIYIANADNTIIRNNWIYDNADRGVQLYPNSRGAQVYGNVIDGNGEGIVISGDGKTASSNNTVEDNMIGNSKIEWNVESNWPNDVVGTGNVVRNNCVYGSNSDSYYNQNGGILPVREGGTGFASLGNQVAKPHFINAAANDFTLASDSPCQFGAGSGVTLKPSNNEVGAGGALVLTGHVGTVSSAGVTIQVLRHGHWRKFAHTKLRSNGRFSLRKRIGRRVARGRARLRAKVPGVGHSRTVAIRVHR